MDIKHHDPYTYHLHSNFAQLLALIRRGHYDDVAELLLAEPAVLKLRDRMGRSALHHCADSIPASTSSIRPNVNADIGKLLIRMMPSMVEWQDNEGNIALHLAVINGDQALVKQLLRAMSVGQINIADYELHTAIHWCVVSGQLDTMTMALDHGADPSTPDIYGAYPLHYATQNFLETVNINGRITPRQYVSTNLKSELISQQQQQQQTFLPKISNINANNNSGVISKRRAKSLRILHQLLTRPQIDVNCVDNERRTPLIWAASSGNHDALLVLVKAGAEISQQDKDGLSALHCASSRGHYSCVHTLITMCGADVHQLDSGGCTPLFYAVALGHPDCVRLLIKSGARLDHQDHKGRTAAHCGASKGQLETLKILHENGANLWLKNVRGDLPLHEAVKSGRVDLVKWLLDQSPKSVNEVNLYGRSPMHIAAFNHNLEMCRLLANYGADMNPVMKIRSQYLTPLDAALQNGTANDELIDYLRKHGAQSIAQIDSQLAEYMRKENDNQNFNLTETDEESKFNFSKKISSLKQQASSNFDVNFSKIKGRSRSKPREVKISEHQTTEEVKQRKSKSKPARFKDDVETEIFSSTTTKLPNLVRQQKNGHYENTDREKRALSSKSASSSPLSSSPPNSVVHSATANSHHHHVHHQYTDKVKNVREFETIIDGTNQETSGGQKHHPTHLKQAIITNVYLTAPAAATLTPVETTIGNTATLATATGTAALLPIYYVKRVPPLKKLSSSSFVGQKRMKKLNGKTKKSRGMVSVLLESHDTFESGGQFREQRTLVQEELGKDKTQKIDSIEHDQDDDDDQEIEDEDKNDELEREETDIVQKTQHEFKSEGEEDLDKSSNIDDNAEVEHERPMLEERTPDSGFETEARKESLKDFYMNRKESFKSGEISAKPELLDAQDEINKNKINESEIESESDNDEGKKEDSSSSSEDDSKKEKKPGWLGSKLETMAKSTSETINGTVSTIKDKLRFDSAGNEIKSIDEDEERRTKEVPEKLIQRDFVQSFSKDDDDNDDDERRKRSVQLEPAFERQKSAESLQSVRSGATSFEEQPEQTEGEIDEGSKTEDGESVLIVMVKDERQEKDESSIVEVFDNETPGIDDGTTLDAIDKPIDQTKNEAGENIDKLAPPPSEIEEFIVKKEIKFKGFDYDKDGDDDDQSTGKEDSIKPDQIDSSELKESEDSILDKGKSFISDGISSLKHETVQVLDQVDEKLEGMEKTLGLGDSKYKDEATTLQETDAETQSVIQQSEPEPSAPVGEEDEKQDIDKETDQLVPIQRVRRGSYTKQHDGYDIEHVEKTKFENSYDGGGSQENLNVNSSSNFVSSFGPVRQLKGKKKSYDHVRPKVNSYWSDEYHQQHALHHQRKDRSPGVFSNSSKHDRYKHDKHHQYGSMGYLASTSHDDYSRIDPKIINQTVEKYLRKYYLERLLFEELYDLKRYQIRTGRTNEPQSVRRLVDRFRREMKAPGMTDFKGPYTYRAYEMYLYDLLRQLSRSNQKKIAYLTKSISYEDLASSFERLQAEAEGISSDEYRSRNRRHQHRDHSEGDYHYKTAHLPTSDVSSETSEMNGGGGGHHGTYDGDENRQSATTRHHIKFDPLSDYDRQPLGLVVDYKYEYHKSQHRAGDGHDGELVDVILENLYKRTGMHGNKMDEMAVSRKIVEKSGNEDNEDGNEEDAVDEKSKQNTKKYAKRHAAAPDNADGVAAHDTAEKVWPDNDRNYRSYSRCSVYGHPGPSIDVNSREIKLARLARTRHPTRKRRFIRKKYQISIPMDQIRKRWHRIKYQERNRHSRFINDTHSSSLDSDVTLWFELNQKWRPKMEIFEPY